MVCVIINLQLYFAEFLNNHYCSGLGSHSKDIVKISSGNSDGRFFQYALSSIQSKIFYEHWDLRRKK